MGGGGDYARRQYSGLSSATERPRTVLRAPLIAGQRRSLETVRNGTNGWSNAEELVDKSAVNPDDRGPLIEYDERVASGRLRDDEHQRG